MYYYRRKSHPLRWILIIITLIVLGVLGYWFYVNYFSKIDFNKEEALLPPDNFQAQAPEILLANISFVQGDVSVNISNNGYNQAVKDTILHQGDRIKTGDNSLAVLNLEESSIIRLAPNTEIVLTNLMSDNIIIDQLAGRTYHNLSENKKYQVSSLGLKATAEGTKFELITNPIQKYLAVLDFENTVKIEIFDDQGMLLAGRLKANEKVLVDLKADKNNLLTFETFTVQSLEKEDWYKWNFDLDQKINEPIENSDINIDEEPDFQAITESLELSSEAKENGIFLSWSAYNKDDFKNYEIVRSETNNDLKYPDDKAIKTSASKGLNSYLDTTAEKNKKYYYRVCVLKLNDKVSCGNVASAEIVMEEEIEDTQPPVAPLLSANISESGVNLSWQANRESDFKEYVILRTFNNANLVYPGDKFSSSKYNQFTDQSVNITSVGNYYYKVCSVDTTDNFACSNIITIENGQIK